MRPTLRAFILLSCLAQALSWQVPSLALSGSFCESFNTCGDEKSGVKCVCTKGCGGTEEDPDTPCLNHNECPKNRQCFREKCIDPCAGLCGENSVCRVEEHMPKCFCKSGYTGNPLYGCDPIVPEVCSTNQFCPNHKFCLEGICVNPCNVIKCPTNFTCKASDHSGLCIFEEKERPQCTYDSNCPVDKKCVSQKCVDPCRQSDEESICHGENTLCQVINHEAFCIIDPIAIECKVHKDCNEDKICKRNKCINPCDDFGSCKEEEECYVSNHRIHCITIPPNENCDKDDDCADDQTCNDIGECENPCDDSATCKGGLCKVTKHKFTCIVPEKDECKEDSECNEHLQCVNQKCVNPCDNKICSEKEKCVVDKHIASCEKEKPECETDDGCDSEMACVDEKCVDPCGGVKCNAYQTCLVEAHKPACKYIKDYECIKHNECRTDQRCLRYKCINPCLSTNACGANETCSVEKHTVICDMIQPDCYSNQDCSTTEACYDGFCKNPCEKMRCDGNKKCVVVDHIASCHGDPDDVECVKSADCKTSEVCISKKCRDLCTRGAKCPPGYLCEARNHIRRCRQTKPPPVFCSKKEDCDEGETCVGNECIEACFKGLCPEGSSCSVEDHIPKCTVIGDEVKQCAASTDCAAEHVCKDGACVHLCIDKKCTDPAICKVENGEVQCTCPPGFKRTEASTCIEDPDTKTGREGDDSGKEIGIGGGGIGNCSANLFWKRPQAPKKYKVYKNRVPWTMAYAYCISHGMRLATIESEEENALILQEIKNTNIKGQGFWVAGVGTPTYGWKWMTTGLPIRNFTYWHNARPIALAHLYYYCMQYYEFYGEFKWYDKPCYNVMENHNFVCEDYES